jgi:polyhydroxyalkanoate synthesis regulator phasin
MIKTDVPGLVTDGKNTVVNKDLGPYYEMVARRKARQEQEATRDEIARLRQEVAELREQVQRLNPTRSTS